MGFIQWLTLALIVLKLTGFVPSWFYVFLPFLLWCCLAIFTFTLAFYVEYRKGK